VKGPSLAPRLTSLALRLVQHLAADLADAAGRAPHLAGQFHRAQPFVLTRQGEAGEKPEQERPKRGGSDTFREKGLKGVLVGFTPEEHDLLKKAAVLAGDGAMSAYVRRVMMEHARGVIERFKGGEG
jgi:hypothetical protein